MSIQPNNYPLGDNPDVDQLNNDYNKLKEEREERDLFFANYKKEFEKIFAEYKQHKPGAANKVIQQFMYVLMPMLLEKTQYTLSIVGDQLNVLSDYRNMIAKVQSDFNGFNQSDSANDSKQPYKDMLALIQAIRKGLDTDGKDGFTVLGKSEVSTMRTALDSLYEQKGTPQEQKGSGALVPKSGSTTEAAGEAYLKGLWKGAADPKSPDGDKIKTITEQFNTISTATSTISQAKQTEVQYQSSAYQQQLGLFNSTLQARAKLFSALVQNERAG